MGTALPTTKPYFGYGSNLWLDQMARRCPSSPYTGLGRLRGYRWIINSRGYANIVQTDRDQDEVWGLIYDLPPEDEERLDGNEGVPYAYQKRMTQVEFWSKGTLPAASDTLPEPEKVKMLVYIDLKRRSGEGNKPRKEYIHRMNEGIRDALNEGVPKSYIDEVLRPYIPAEELDEATKEEARSQAGRFVDQSGVFVRTGSGAGGTVQAAGET